jgi:hypothetical protein
MYHITCDFKFFSAMLSKFSGDQSWSHGSWVSLSDPLSALLHIFLSWTVKESDLFAISFPNN